MDTSKISRVDYATVAKHANMSESTLMYILKQVVMAVETAMRKNYQVKLNLRLGFLKFQDGVVRFDNLATK